MTKRNTSQSQVRTQDTIQTRRRGHEAVGLTQYLGPIVKAIARAEAGNCFAPFEPEVLKALATEYVKGPFEWSDVCDRLEAANANIALNDLDRAMHAMFDTGPASGKRENFSLLIGGAMASAEAGNQDAPFGWDELDALGAFYARGTTNYDHVLGEFGRVNKDISIESLNSNIEGKMLDLLKTPNASGFAALWLYEWNRPDSGSANELVYWVPVNKRLHRK